MKKKYNKYKKYIDKYPTKYTYIISKYKHKFPCNLLNENVYTYDYEYTYNYRYKNIETDKDEIS